MMTRRFMSPIIRRLILAGLVALILSFLPIMANAGQYENFRFPREKQLTKDGYPTPLSGQPITKTPVIAKKKGCYPEEISGTLYPRERETW